MAANKTVDAPTKFTVEYFTEDKKLDSRWHYNYEKTQNGPVLVEHFIFPKLEEGKKKSAKKK